MGFVSSWSGELDLYLLVELTKAARKPCHEVGELR